MEKFPFENLCANEWTTHILSNKYSFLISNKLFKKGIDFWPSELTELSILMISLIWGLIFREIKSFLNGEYIRIEYTSHK